MNDVPRMACCPVPAYLVGVDEPGGQAYVVSVHRRMTGPLASMPAQYPLACANLRWLWGEVKDYGQPLDPSARTSVFLYA